MKDEITIKRIANLHPIIREETLSIYINEIVPALTSSTFCRFAYTLRTFEEQDLLFAQGRTRLFDNNGTRLGKVTNAKGGQSYHNYGLALDIVLIDGRRASWDVAKDYDDDSIPDWLEIANIFESHGWVWGRTFNDSPHFQKTLGYHWSELLAKHNEKDFIPGTTYVNI